MKYQGKKRLYEFLVSHGYSVPKMKEMEYKFYRGSEWLRTFSRDIEIYASFPDYIRVTKYGENELGKMISTGLSVYRYGELYYQISNGKVVQS